MAKLPGYDSSRQMDTSAPAVMRDMAVEQTMGKNIQTLGKAARDISKVWQAAEDSAQKLSSQNKLDEGQREIFARAGKDIDYKNSAQYHEDLDTLNRESLEGFTNNEAAAEFSITSNNQTSAAKIKIDGVFREKLLDWKNANVIRSGKGNHTEYIEGDLGAIEKQRKVIEDALPEAGFEVTEKRLQELEKWDYDRAIHDAQNGKLLPLDQYQIQPGKKDDLAREIKQIAEIRVKLNDVAVLEKQATNQKKFVEDQTAGMSLEESLDRLDTALETKSMDKTWAETRRASILSAAGVDAEMQADYFYEIVQKINRANAKYKIKKSSKNAKDYIRESNEALIMINEGRADGRIDLKSEGLLNTRIYTKDVAEAEQDAGKKLIAATEYFEATLTPDEVPLAIVDYFERTQKTSKHANAKEEALLNDIQRKVRGDSTARAKEAVDIITAREAAQQSEELSDDQILKRFNVTDAELKANMAGGKTKEEIVNHLRKVLKK